MMIPVHPKTPLDSVGVLDETSFQGCWKRFWICESLDPICDVANQRFVVLTVVVADIRGSDCYRLLYPVEDLSLAVWVPLLSIPLSDWFWWIEGSLEDSQERMTIPNKKKDRQKRLVSWFWLVEGSMEDPQQHEDR